MELLKAVLVDFFGWVFKIGFLVAVVKICYDHYRRVVAQRDRAIAKNLNLRFDSVKEWIEALGVRVGAVESSLASLKTDVTLVKPAMESCARSVEEEIGRYERIIEGIKASLTKADGKFHRQHEEILGMKASLSEAALAITALNTKISQGKIVLSRGQNRPRRTKKA